MKIHKLHDWTINYRQAIELQKKLAQKLVFEKIRTKPKLIAGIDCAFSKNGKNIAAYAVVQKIGSYDIVETAYCIEKVDFPYIPGLLSFREAPACINAAAKLKNEPDIFMIDGQGFAHPRRLGIASHLGLWFDRPTIGCAKSLLIGTYSEPKIDKGQTSPLMDNNEQIGMVLRTRKNVKPVFVSVGHKIMLEDAVKYTLEDCIKYRIPEPTRIAHQLVTKLKGTI